MRMMLKVMLRKVLRKVLRKMLRKMLRMMLRMRHGQHHLMDNQNKVCIWPAEISFYPPLLGIYAPVDKAFCRMLLIFLCIYRL